jgi:hypothetical protein
MKFVNNIVLFIFSPFYVLFFTLFSLNTVYLDSPYFYNLILFSILCFQWVFKRRFDRKVLFLFFYFFIIFIIEFFNYIRFFDYYKTFQINFLKLFFYNTFHGGILSLVLIGSIFISGGIVFTFKFVNSYTINLIKWMPLYPVIWFLYRFNIVGGNVNESSLLLNNVSYYFLFVYMYRVYADGITLNKNNLFILSNLFFIFYLNETRGALLILGFFIFYILYLSLKKKSTILYKLMLFSLSTIFIITFYIYFDFFKFVIFELFDFVSNNSFTDFADSKASDITGIENENSFSNLSRIGTNLLSINIYLNNIVTGIGFYPSHNLRFLGDGIHSFVFYCLTSFGSIGVISLFLIFKTLKTFFLTREHIFFRCLLFFALYLMMNQMSPFIFLIFMSVNSPDLITNKN